MERKIKISEILEMLDNGKKRQEIADHYGISIQQCRQLFKHKKLIGRWPKRKINSVSVDIIDDVVEEKNVPVESVEVDNLNNLTQENE